LGDCLLLQFFENYRSSQHYIQGYFSPWLKGYAFLSKIDWATFWAIFSQTHQVTLFREARIAYFLLT
jgi:hypothetical protein